MRRVAGTVAVLVGAALGVAVFATGSIPRATSAATVLEAAGPSASGPGLAALRSGLDAVAVGVDDLLNSALPETAAARGATVEELLGRDADLATVAKDAEILVGDADRTVANLERLEPHFRQADSLRRLPVPLAAMPWATLALAAVLVVLGIATVVDARWAGRSLAGISVLGVLTVAVPLVLGVPGKLGAAATVLEGLRPDPTVTARVRTQVDTVARAARVLDAEVLPAVRAAGATTPAITSMQRRLDDTVRRYDAAVRFREEHGAEVAALKELPLRHFAVGFPAAGAFLAVTAAVALATARAAARRRADEVAFDAGPDLSPLVTGPA